MWASRLVRPTARSFAVARVPMPFQNATRAPNSVWMRHFASEIKESDEDDRKTDERPSDTSAPKRRPSAIRVKSRKSNALSTAKTETGAGLPDFGRNFELQEGVSDNVKPEKRGKVVRDSEGIYLFEEDDDDEGIFNSEGPRKAQSGKGPVKAASKRKRNEDFEDLDDEDMERASKSPANSRPGRRSSDDFQGGFRNRDQDQSRDGARRYDSGRPNFGDDDRTRRFETRGSNFANNDRSSRFEPRRSNFRDDDRGRYQQTFNDRPTQRNRDQGRYEPRRRSENGERSPSPAQDRGSRYNWDNAFSNDRRGNPRQASDYEYRTQRQSRSYEGNRFEKMEGGDDLRPRGRLGSDLSNSVRRDIHRDGRGNRESSEAITRRTFDGEVRGKFDRPLRPDDESRQNRREPQSGDDVSLRGDVREKANQQREKRSSRISPSDGPLLDARREAIPEFVDDDSELPASASAEAHENGSDSPVEKKKAKKQRKSKLTLSEQPQDAGTSSDTFSSDQKPDLQDLQRELVPGEGRIVQEDFSSITSDSTSPSSPSDSGSDTSGLPSTSALESLRNEIRGSIDGNNAPSSGATHGVEHTLRKMLEDDDSSSSRSRSQAGVTAPSQKRLGNPKFFTQSSSPEEQYGPKLVPSDTSQDFYYGKHPVELALRWLDKDLLRRCRLFVQEGLDEKDRAEVELAREIGVPITITSKYRLNEVTGNPPKPHQGIMLEMPKIDFRILKQSTTVGIPQLEGDRANVPLLMLALDEVSDPMNMGAILRSAHFFSVFAILASVKNSSPITPTVVKASSGSAMVMHAQRRLLGTKNLVTSLEAHKAEGWRVIGTSASNTGTQGGKPVLDISKLEKHPRTILVMGGEEEGIRTLVRDQCDAMIHLPSPPRPPLTLSTIYQKVTEVKATKEQLKAEESIALNVSAATAAILSRLQM